MHLVPGRANEISAAIREYASNTSMSVPMSHQSNDVFYQMQHFESAEPVQYTVKFSSPCLLNVVQNENYIKH